MEHPGDLWILAKRYRNSDPSQRSDNISGPRLIPLFAHALGYHKEHWEPTLEALFDINCQPSQHAVLHIQEAWCIDCQDHGESAILNEEALLTRPRFISGYDYAQTFDVLIKSGLVDFSAQARIILIGHSAGAASVILATLPVLDHRIEKIILVEPSRSALLTDRMISLSQSQRDVWENREEARQWMLSRNPWRRWDPRVLDHYVTHGLRHPRSQAPTIDKTVTLSCTKDVQATAYRHSDVQFEVLDRLSEICPLIPVHVVFGTEADHSPLFIQNGICSPNGIPQVASVTRIPQAGHMVRIHHCLMQTYYLRSVPQIVEEAPEGLAYALWAIMARNVPQPRL
ncbi:Alpha/beta hydrolase family-domain-containing protein [Mucidula mucida]|nr:Alpha/beta hydrolase family-domain-containing protein [Mucidula mucida]